MDMELEQGNAYLLLGSNLGDRNQNLEDAIGWIAREVGEVFAKSSVYETAHGEKQTSQVF